MHETLTELLEIELSDNSDKNSFHVRDNFERFHNEYPFLYNSIGVGSAIEVILKESNDANLINFAINKIGESDKHKYTRRNYILILADLFLEQGDLTELEKIVKEKLKDEFKFHGYRKLLIYFSENYNEKLFLEVFKKIEKKNTLMPITRNAINLFIEKYSSKNKNIDKIKEFVRKKKIYPNVHYYLEPMLLGYLGKNPDFKFLEKLIWSEIEDECERFYRSETIYYELYERSVDDNYKIKLLLSLENLCERTPKELYMRGYPSKLWTLLYWRIGCKYLDLDKKEKVEKIIKILKGKNKISLKEMYKEKYEKTNANTGNRCTTH